MSKALAMRGSERGQIEQRYHLRCLDCTRVLEIYGGRHQLTFNVVVRSARDHGWSLSSRDNRWRCTACAALHRKKPKT